MKSTPTKIESGTYLIAVVNILLSTIIYFYLLFSIKSYHASVQGWVQFFTWISCIIMLVNSLSLASLLSKVENTLAFLSILILFSLLGIISIGMQSSFFMVFAILITLGVTTISYVVLRKSKPNFLLGINISLFVMNVIWLMLMNSTV